MLRVKLTKANKHGNKGDVLFLDRNEAFGLIDSGQAIITKDITESDEEQADGSNFKLRTHHSK